ncbi:hypothetical protein Aduo_008614 [Ancylostoma duodenale]
MTKAELEEAAKKPILLLPAHPLTEKIVKHYHIKLFHAGSSHLLSELRHTYYVPQIRRTVNAVIAKCTTCRRYQGRHYSYPKTPDLPVERVRRSRPFQHVGKVWVCLFTCMATRALHLELLIVNTFAQFLLAFRRFIARRSVPDTILSDNAPTFKLGREILVNELIKIEEDASVRTFAAENDVKWNFITPRSPWKGGFYERLVASVKMALKKTVRKHTIDLWTRKTLLFEIEATLNTRPITPVSTNPSGETYILGPIDLINPNFRLGRLGEPNRIDNAYYDPSVSDSRELILSLYKT